MKKLILTFILSSFSANAQVVLQPWTQVYGTVGGQKLGAEVKGIMPTANLLYKASIYSFGNTGLYTLQTPNDTGAQRVFFGTNMQTGDLNGDGWKDIVIRRGGTGSTVDTVLAYWGTPTGIDTLNPLLILGENPGDAFRPACIGDVNNDGRMDLIISAGDFPHPFGRGKIYIYLNPLAVGPPDGTILGDTTDSGLGITCSVADLNSDGFNDLAIRGWNQLGPTAQRHDYVNIYWGIGSDTLNLTLGLQLRGYNLNSQGLACFDANGDGIADLLWTNRDSVGDWVYIHYGGSNFSTTPNLKFQNPGVANFGNIIVGVGDMNGDGFLDIAVAASQANQTSGFVFVYGGGPLIDGTFDAAIGMSSNSDFGRSVSSVGDVTGDGLADIIIGAPNWEFGISNKGYWGIFKGDSTIQVTDIEEVTTLPSVIKLHHCFPNPFNPATTIRYEVSQSAYVKLQVFDMLGQHIATLDEQDRLPGSYETVFDGTRFASGVYLYRLTAKTLDGYTYTDTKKLILTK